MVEFITIEKGSKSDYGIKADMVILDAEEWRQVWRRHKSSFSPQPSAPQVDFEIRMVAAVFDSVKRMSGHSVEITEVVTRQTTSGNLPELLIKVKTRESSSSARMESLTQPFHIISLPTLAFSWPPIFEWT